MDFGNFSSPLWTFASTIALAFTSAIIPLVNAELLILFVASVAPRPLLPALVIAATLAHMLGKTCMYFCGRALDRLPPGRFRDRIARGAAMLDRQKGLGSTVIFVSSLIGFPPFYVVTVASGVMRFHFWHYFIVGISGRLIRFGAIAFFPQAVKAFLE